MQKLDYNIIGSVAAVVAIASIMTLANAESECSIEKDVMKCNGVLQEGLDQADIDTLWSIWREQAFGNYTRPPEQSYPTEFEKYGGGYQTKDDTWSLDWANSQESQVITDEDLNVSNSTAQNTLCTHDLYSIQFKKMQGCKLNYDGTFQ